MDERELAARTAELTRMFVAFSDKPDPDRLRVYLEELQEYPFPVFRAAVRSATRNQKIEWAPAIGRIRECAVQPLLDHRQRQEELREQQELAAGGVVRLIEARKD